MSNITLLTIAFEEPLSKVAFDCWIQMMVRKQNNNFRFSGAPIRLGPTKVQSYGIDTFGWRPLNLELTEKGLVAFQPEGICGDTFHRLVANVRLYVSPKAKAWLGEEPFEVKP